MQHAMRYVAVVTLAAGCVLPWGTHSQGQTKKTEPTVMQRKLTHAQGVLNGLALADFEQITKHAEGLLHARQDATWRINETEQYLRHSNAFAEQIEHLKQASKQKNLDKATLAYVEMTLTCVKCHEALRIGKVGQRKDD